MNFDAKLFASINETAQITGLSSHYVRKGVRSGEIPCIKSGQKYFVKLPAFFRSLGLAWPPEVETAGRMKQGKGGEKRGF